MPKRVIDFDAMWGSDKLASCAAWAQAEYAWLYGLADASGCFELTNLRVIWGRVAAVRANLTIERLEQVFVEFQDKGLLFVWEHEGKRYGHWTGSDVPGRLPAPSWRARLEKFAPPVPKRALGEYMARFARGRASMGGGGFSGAGAGVGAAQEMGVAEGDLRSEISDLRDERPGEAVARDCGDVERADLRDAAGVRGGGACGGEGDFRSEPSNLREAGEVPGGRVGMRELSGIKAGVEEAQAEDWNLNLNGNGEKGWGAAGGALGAVSRGSLDARTGEDLEKEKNSLFDLRAKDNATTNANSQLHFNSKANANSSANALTSSTANANSAARANANFNTKTTSNSNANALTSSSASAGVSENWKGAETFAGPPGGIRAGESLRDGGGAVAKRTQTEACTTRSAGAAQGASDAGGGRGRFVTGRELVVARELRVGAGPVCGASRVRPEVLERERRRELARAAAGGS